MKLDFAPSSAGSSHVSTLHNWKHDDFSQAKQHIYQMLGSLDRMRVFGRDLLVAVYVRPNISAVGLHMGTKMQDEDQWQGKALLIVKMGPDAFEGDDAYRKARFGDDPPPKVGDWIFARASDGVAISYKGDGAQRVRITHRNGDVEDVYKWGDGWPCRVISDESVWATADEPTSIV